MSLSAAALLALATNCAPGVAPETVLAIIRTESRGRIFALNVNGARQPAPQTSAADAGAVALRYIAAGYSVDLGLGQINSRNMGWLGLTWETVFDPCTNVAALGRVMTANYRVASPGRDPQVALRVALSMYNTGSTSRGFRNGYVAKVVGNAGIADRLPAAATAPVEANAPQRDVLRDMGDLPKMFAAENGAAQGSTPTPRQSAPPHWNVFERAAFERQMTIIAEQERARS